MLPILFWFIAYACSSKAFQYLFYVELCSTSFTINRYEARVDDLSMGFSLLALLVCQPIVVINASLFIAFATAIGLFSMPSLSMQLQFVYYWS